MDFENIAGNLGAHAKFIFKTVLSAYEFMNNTYTVA
jgi:hypothetical protein